MSRMLPEGSKRPKARRKPPALNGGKAVRHAMAQVSAVEQNKAITEILRVISASPGDVQPVLRAVAQSAARLCHAANVHIRLVKGDLMPVAEHVGAISIAAEAQTQRISGNSVAGRAIIERRTIHIHDVTAADVRSEYPEAAFLKADQAFRSLLVVPLLRNDSAIGTISVRRAEVLPFSEEHIKLLETFAAQAVIAIENAQLFAETKAALEQQTATAEILKAISESPTDIRPVFQSIAERAARLCEAGDASVFVVSGEKVEFVAHSGQLPPAAPSQSINRGWLTGRALMERTSVQVEDVLAVPEQFPTAQITAKPQGVRTVLSLPLMLKDVAVGAITLRRREVRPFSDKQIALLKTFADQAAIAIENVRLLNETKESLERQTATSDVLTAISGAQTDVGPVFEAIARNAQRLCGAVVCNVLHYDGDMLHIAASHGFSPEQEKKLREKYPVKAGDKSVLSGRVIVSRRIEHIDDVQADPAYDHEHAANVAGWRRMLGVPMLRDDEPLGVIVVAWRDPGKTSASEIELLKTFAAQATIAIENVRLFNETKEALDQQKASAEVLGTISSSIADTQPVFDKIVESCRRLFAGKQVGILLARDDGLAHVAAFYRDRTPDELLSPVPITHESATGRAILTRQVQHYPDIFSGKDVPRYLPDNARRFGIRSGLFAPMLWQGRGVGCIYVVREQTGEFSEKEIRLLKTFADQAVIAIENVRLFNETKEALEQQKASAEVLGAISSSIADTSPVFEKIMQSCERLFQGHFMGIGLVSEDSRIRIVARRGLQVLDAPQEPITTVPFTKEAGAGLAILERRVVHYPDVFGQQDVPPFVRKGAEKSGFKSIVFAPMFWEDQGIGAIWVGRSVTGPFSEKQIALLKTFADQAVIAIQNARLFREIQEKSAQLEVANKHKSDFLANMSHELRTPLNAIIGFSEAMMEQMFGELNEKQLDYQKDIHESGKHLLSLINDILDLSKIEAGRMELELSTFHLPTAVSNAVILVRERAMRHGIALGVDIDKRLGEFQADERKVKQILLNLLSNAVKFTPDGGRVDVSAKLDTDKVEIAVKDTGVGIAPEEQAALFEEFKQLGKDSSRKAEGTGLGLALTKRLVELHGGQILVDSAVGKGSTFRVLLPARV